MTQELDQIRAGNINAMLDAVIHGMAWDHARYLYGFDPPNYPVPAIRQRTFESLRKLGYSSAENKFPIDIVFENYIKL